MTTQVQKWGNSLALRIPTSVAAEFNIEEGSPVNLSAVHGRIIVELVLEPTYDLDDLLSRN